MSGNYRTIKVSQETYDFLLECVQDYLKHHPEMKETYITKNKIIYELCKYYVQ